MMSSLGDGLKQILLGQDILTEILSGNFQIEHCHFHVNSLCNIFFCEVSNVLFADYKKLKFGYFTYKIWYFLQ